MKTLIIGGGLSGLALAEALDAQGHDYLLVEARSRLGGRILTQHLHGGYFDIGPAWFWEGQPRIAAMIRRFSLVTFGQFADGALTFEDEQGRVHHGRGFSSMEGSLRLVGGMAALTDALGNRIPVHRKRLNAAVTQIEHAQNRIIATLANGEAVTAEQVVLAVPPRVAARITFSPALPGATIQVMHKIPTWMAGQAKAIAVYKAPFWREQGLSGDAMSRMGPMVEIHDASPANGGPYALFGFIGVPPQNRMDAPVLEQHIRAQLKRLFGPEAADPTALLIKDWAFDPQTATEADKAPLYAHPAYGLPTAMTNIWDGKVLLAGTEVAPQFGGYVEGALEAAENVLRQL